MAKIPQYKQSTLPPGGEDFPGGTFAPIYFAEEVGNSVSRAGQSLANLGNTLSDIHIKQQKAQEALDISNALSDLQVRVDETYQKHKLEEQDPVLFESKFQESANTIFEDVLSKQTKNVAKGLQPYLKELSGRYQIRAKSDVIKKQVDIGQAQRITSEDILRNTALEGYKQGDFEAGYEAVQKYDNLLQLHQTTGLIGPDDAAAESLRFKKSITRDGYLLAIQNDPESALQNLQDNPDPFLDPLTHQELIGTASKAITQFHDAQQKAEKEIYTNFVETSVQDAFAGNLDTETINSPDFKSKFKDPADYDKVVRARNQPQVSDPDVYGNLIQRINIDPYSLKQDDIVSAEGISVSDKNKAIEELQRNQEITSRPNYKAARELFDIDFKQQFGAGAMVDPEDQAKWLRVFHSYIIDKKMEPLDAAEKIRKDYQSADVQAGITQSPPGRGRGGLDKSETQNPKSDIDPNDSLFAVFRKIPEATKFSATRSIGGIAQLIGDVTGSESVKQYGQDVFQGSNIELAKIYEGIPPGSFKENLLGAGVSVGQNIPAVFLSAATANPFTGLAIMGALSGGQEYGEAKAEGASTLKAGLSAAGHTISEIGTELMPMSTLLKPGISFAKRIFLSTAQDIFGEDINTIVQSAITYARQYPNKTFKEFYRSLLQALKQTTIQTAMAGPATGAIVHPFTKGTAQETTKTEQAQQQSRVGTAHQPPGEQTQQTQPATETQQTQQKDVQTSQPKTKEISPPQGKTFLKTSKGTFDFGNIDENVSKAINKPAAPIVLEPGNDEYGKIHIERKHIEKLKKAGYESVESFVEDVASNYTKIWEQPNGRLMLVKENGDAKLSIIELQEYGEGKYYGVSTAFIAEKNYPQRGGRKLLWERSVPLSTSPEQLAPLTNVTPKDTQVGDAWRSGQSNSPTNTIQQGQESVKPEITLMPPLQNLVDNSKLSLEDALEINDIATQNNWSEDTVRQFYKNAVEGLGIQNKETQSLASLLVTAKVKAAVYKQNAEQYKQEIEVNEKLIKTLYDRLNIKIEGGAPDKYETVANDFIKNLGDLKNLKPEEIIQKAQEELALNLNRLDTGMDVKTLIAATVKTINEAEGISKETVSHGQTIQEAMKELPTIYNKVINLKRGKTLTRQQQLAARILGVALFEGFNKTRLLGMADPNNTELSQKAMTQLIELGQYWSKVLASSSEMGRELEAQKIIAKVGEDIPATEEFQKILGMLQGQNEITPEQFYQLTGALRTPDQLAEMAREMAKPVSRRIQDIFLEAWINGLLSNPQTHATNILSNLYTTFASIPERYLAAKTHYGDKSGVVDGEAKAMLFGMQMGFRDAVNAARLVWATETGRFGKTAQKVENAQQKAISSENINRILAKFGVDPMNQTLSNAVDYVGKIWRLPTRALMTADEFFKMINYRMELQALAYRQAAMEGLTGDKAGARIAELIQKPTVEMRARAIAHANIQTFTGEMGPVATAISSVTERVPMAKIIVPFVRTPSNIFTYTFDRTPFLAYARSQIRADIKAGGAARDMALGKMAFGGMIAGLAATLAASGFITGSGPEDRELKKTMRDNGWQPNSIRIGNTYYSYKRMDPVGMLIGMIADSTEIMGSLDDYSAGKLAMSVVLSMEHNLLDNLYLDGIMNVLDAIQDPGKQWHDYFKKQAGSLIPAISGDIARGFDPVVHDTKSIVDTMRSRIPGFSMFAPAQRNIFGEKVLRGGSLGNDFISPIWQSKAKQDPVLDEIIKHEISIHPPSRYIGGAAPSEIDPMARDNPKAGVPLNPQQYDRLQEITGQGLRDALEKLIKKPLYQKQSDGPDGGKALLIRSVVERAREIGRQKLLKEDQQLYEQLKAKYRERRVVLQPKR